MIGAINTTRLEVPLVVNLLHHRHQSILNNFRNFSLEFSNHSVNSPDSKKSNQNNSVNVYQDLLNRNKLGFKLISYQLFAKERFKLIRENNASLKIPEVVKLLATEWAVLESKEKMIWIEQGKEQKRKNSEKLEDFLKDMTLSEREKLKLNLADKTKALAEKKLKKQSRIDKKKFNKPTWSGAYSLFMKDKFKENYVAGTMAKDRVKEIAAKWNALTDADKEVYKNKSKELNSQYLKDLTVWESQMCNDGYEYLLRQTSRKDLNKGKK